jgi:ribonucleoside-diphosphate reductase alpha chain
MAAAITSLMTGTSYRRSAELAAVVGPYAGYARNADAHKRVMRKHQAANDALRTVGTLDSDVRKRASKAWDGGLRIGETNGYRNAKPRCWRRPKTIEASRWTAIRPASEPDFSLVKFKKLVWALMQIVSQTIPRAQEPRLRDRDRRGDHRVHRRTRPRDRRPGRSLSTEVFDTAPGPAGHRPMESRPDDAAASRSCRSYLAVNLPESATVEEIADVYLRAGSSVSRRSPSTATTARSGSR